MTKIGQGRDLDQMELIRKVSSRVATLLKSPQYLIKVAALFESLLELNQGRDHVFVRELNQGRDLDFKEAAKTPYTQDGQKLFKSDIPLTGKRVF